MLIDGFSQREMSAARGLKMRTLKSEFSRIYRRNEIRGGVPRVKLAVLFWREQNGVK